MPSVITPELIFFYDKWKLRYQDRDFSKIIGSHHSIPLAFLLVKRTQKDADIFISQKYNLFVQSYSCRYWLQTPFLVTLKSDQHKLPFSSFVDAVNLMLLILWHLKHVSPSQAEEPCSGLQKCFLRKTLIVFKVSHGQCCECNS